MNIYSSDVAAVIHETMLAAFAEYRDSEIPSSALDETVDTVALALQKGEQALVGEVNGDIIAMVRYQLQDNNLYFSRLSVIPTHQGNGYAKQLVQALDMVAKTQGKSIIQCKVRMTVPRNIALYQKLGFIIASQEVLHERDGLTIVTMEKYL